MEVLLYLFLGLLVLLILLTVAFWLLNRYQPQLAQTLLTPLGKLLMHSKRGRKLAGEVLSKELAQNPEQLEGLAAQVGGRQAAKQMETLMAGRSEKDRQQMLKTVITKTQSGQ